MFPPTYPPSNRPGRNTNQLLYIKRRVLPALWQHKFSWPFKKPVTHTSCLIGFPQCCSVQVDAVKLRLPDYHTIIKQPMDLGTVKKRLVNKYYWCGKEAEADLRLVFTNCCLYNKPDQDIAFMGRTLESLLNSRLTDLPHPEVSTRPEIFAVAKCPA